MERPDGRALDAHRPVEMTLGFQRNAEGSVLYRAGRTVVLCTASVENVVPAWMTSKGKGWITAEYQMHPRSTPQRREAREGRSRTTSGRTQEIQRLVGRALRAAVDLKRLGERTITIDCDVLEADGGTRTASVTAGFVALALALDCLKTKRVLRAPVLRDQVAAVSVGHLAEGFALDLVYTEDSAARVDMNVVATSSGSVVEVQAATEGEAITRGDLDRMLELGLAGVASLARRQCEALVGGGVDLGSLFQEGRWIAP